MTAAVREAWAIFQRRYCRMESPAVFFIRLLFNGKFPCTGELSSLSAGKFLWDFPLWITAFVCDRAEKPPKEKMAAAATAETGYGREP